jgi:membrane protein
MTHGKHPWHTGTMTPPIWKRTGTTAVTAMKEFAGGQPMGQAAAIAYYTIFSMPAVLIITVMAAATLFDEADVRNALFSQAGRFIGPSTAGSLQDLLVNARITETRFMAKVVGIAALVISAGSVFASLQSTLNEVWQVEAKPGRAILRYLTTRLLSMALVGCFGFLMLVSLVLDAALVALTERLVYWLSGATTLLLAALNVVLSFGIITVIFALIFKVLPDGRIRWSDVWSGALITALLFSLGKWLIGLYIGYTGVGDTYGAAGAVVVVLVWVYYSAVILIYGAHFTHVHTRDHGSGVRPSPHAIKEAS